MVESLGLILKKQRLSRDWKIAKLTQELAKKGQQASFGYLSGVETGRIMPSVKFIILIADVYALDRDKLFDVYKKEKVRKYEESYEKYISAYIRKKESSNEFYRVEARDGNTSQ
jgi:transcriptional regulator with XRE-family HTH domain